MKLLKTLALLVFLVAPKAFPYEKGNWTTVTQLFSQNNGDIFVTFGNDSMPGCYNNNGARLKGADTERLYSTILSAFMSGKSVKPLYIYDNTTEGYSGWSLCYIYAVYVK